jgi:hypothetical protein
VATEARKPTKPQLRYLRILAEQAREEHPCGKSR